MADAAGLGQVPAAGVLAQVLPRELGGSARVEHLRARAKFVPEFPTGHEAYGAMLAQGRNERDRRRYHLPGFGPERRLRSQGRPAAVEHGGRHPEVLQNEPDPGGLGHAMEASPSSRMKANSERS
ncbi:hypothetical protein [Methylobacterium sp. OAE515]|uniref:hypothetical protein n=1 Tax=Methylobacterium sp. OAE515 TaxID=2817895 RepID=UPI00178B93DE